IAMIARQAKIYTALQYGIDLILTAVSWIAAYYIRLYLPEVLLEEWTPWLAHYLYPFSHYAWLLLLILPIWLGLISSLNFYRKLTRLSLIEQIRLLIHLEIFGGILLGFALFLLKLNVSRPLMVIFLATNFALLLAERIALKIKIK